MQCNATPGKEGSSEFRYVMGSHLYEAIYQMSETNFLSQRANQYIQTASFDIYYIQIVFFRVEANFNYKAEYISLTRQGGSHDEAEAEFCPPVVNLFFSPQH